MCAVCRQPDAVYEGDERVCVVHEGLFEAESRAGGRVSFVVPRWVGEDVGRVVGEEENRGIGMGFVVEVSWIRVRSIVLCDGMR